MNLFKQTIYNYILPTNNNIDLRQGINGEIFFGEPLICQENFPSTTYSTSYNNQITFQNNCISGKDFRENVSYYIHFEIKKETTKNNKIILKLTSNNENYNNNDQNIQILEIQKANSNIEDNNYEIFDIIFTPYTNNFNILVWEQERTLNDIIEFSKTNNFDDKITIKNIKIYSLNNLINNLDNNIKEITKLGIQSHPFIFIVLNGEPIRVGRNGIYEITEGVKINSLCLAPISTGSIILDYKYNTK